jgi:type II secretory pathway pseudopilin PulG
MIHMGTLPRNVLVWTEGMADWATYESLFPVAVPPPLPPAVDSPRLDIALPEPVITMSEPAGETAPGEQIPAPGARMSLHCGIWGMVGMVLFFPVGVVLAILAIVQGSKAQGLARRNPQRYQKPGRAGFVMGIIALVLLPFLAVVGIISAIAIPALLGQRARARDKVSIQRLEGALSDLVTEFDKAKEANQPEAATKAQLDTCLVAAGQGQSNPWNPGAPAYSNVVVVVNGGSQEQLEASAREQATVLGQPTYYIEFPVPGQAGCLVGAVRLNSAVNGETVLVRSVCLEN